MKAIQPPATTSIEASERFTIRADRLDLIMRRSCDAKIIIKTAPVDRARNVMVLMIAKSGNAIAVMSIISGNTSGNRIIM